MPGNEKDILHRYKELNSNATEMRLKAIYDCIGDVEKRNKYTFILEKT